VHCSVDFFADVEEDADVGWCEEEARAAGVQQQVLHFAYREPGCAQVLPCWVGGFDQCNFLCADPAFEFLFALDGFADICEFLKPDETVAVVFCCEAVVRFLFVIEGPLAHIVGDAGVERPAFAGHDVCEVTPLDHGESIVGGVGCGSAVGHGALLAPLKTKADPSPRLPLCACAQWGPKPRVLRMTSHGLVRGMGHT